MDFQVKFEEFKVQARELVDKVKELIHEGNIRRIIVKDEKGNTFMEIPVNVAALGVIAAPILAAVGALTALVARFTLVVERAKPGAPEEAAPPVETPTKDPGPDPGNPA